MQEKKKKKLGGQQGELMRALNITMDDLLANDEGYITEEQQESVLSRQSGQWLGFYIMSGVFTAMSLFFGGITMVKPDKLVPLVVMAGIFLVVGILFGAGAFLYRHKVKQELKKSHVETVQGIAVVVTSIEESHLEINGMKLNAPPDVLRRVKHLDPYIIHYLPESKIILSMEQIEENSNIRESSARLQDDATLEDLDLDYIDEELQSTLDSGGSS